MSIADWPPGAKREMLKFLANRHFARKEKNKRLGPQHDQIIRDLWANLDITLFDMEIKLGFSRGAISLYARNKLGLPKRPSGIKGLRIRHCNNCGRQFRSANYHFCQSCRYSKARLTYDQGLDTK